MSDFKSEVLPSGAELQISNEIYCISTAEHYVQVTKADIARMHGIAFPEKRHPGTCSISTASPQVDDINVADLQPPAASDKYEQRVNDAAQFYANSYNSYAAVPSEELDMKDFQYEGRREVARQAEAIREALGYCLDSDTHMIDTEIINYLNRNGYVPSPINSPE